MTPEKAKELRDLYIQQLEAEHASLRKVVQAMPHHRAQLGLYLRLAGEKVPSIYGPTLDVSFEDLVPRPT